MQIIFFLFFFFFEISSLLDVKHCPKLQSSAISRKTNEPNLRKWQKTKLQARFWPVLTQKFGPEKFFSWVLPILNIIYCCKLLLHAISRKTNEPNLRKWQIFMSDFGFFGPNLSRCCNYHCMEFQGKPINKTWKNDKKPSFRTNFGPFDTNSGRQKTFFSKIWLFQSLYIMVSYHHVQYQKKLMIQSWQNLVTVGRMGKWMRVIS